MKDVHDLHPQGLATRETNNPLAPKSLAYFDIHNPFGTETQADDEAETRTVKVWPWTMFSIRSPQKRWLATLLQAPTRKR